MDCTPNAKAIEELSERIAEQMKGIVQRIGKEAREEKRTLEWFEKQAVIVLKGVGQTLVGCANSMPVPILRLKSVVCAAGWPCINGGGQDKRRRYWAR